MNKEDLRLANKEELEVAKLSLEVEDLVDKRIERRQNKTLRRLAIIGFYGSAVTFALNFFQPIVLGFFNKGGA